MNYWAVDDANISPPNDLTIFSNRVVNMRHGDEVVLFKRVGDNDIEFHTRAIIEESQVGRYEEDKQKYVAHLSNLRVLTDSSLLSELTYSLQKIYNFRQPRRHFLRKYLSLSQYDFDSITSGSIYWARTAFGIYINMLGRQQLEHFIQETAASSPEVFIHQWDFGLAWKVLRQFIEVQYIAAAELLRFVHARADQISGSDIPNLNYMELGVSTEDGENDSLYEQEVLLSKFLAATRPEEGDLLERLSHRIAEESASQEAFQEAFRYTSWPLQTIEG